MANNRPTLKKGPATAYQAPNEVIREFGNGKGDGGLLSLRNMDDGSLVVEVYQVSGPVVIHTPGATQAQGDDLMVSYSDIRQSLALILGSGTTNILGALDDAVSNNRGD